jgi:hypothetical protein
LELGLDLEGDDYNSSLEITTVFNSKDVVEKTTKTDDDDSNKDISKGINKPCTEDRVLDVVGDILKPSRIEADQVDDVETTRESIDDSEDESKELRCAIDRLSVFENNEESSGLYRNQAAVASHDDCVSRHAENKRDWNQITFGLSVLVSVCMLLRAVVNHPLQNPTTYNNALFYVAWIGFWVFTVPWAMASFLVIHKIECRGKRDLRIVFVKIVVLLWIACSTFAVVSVSLGHPWYGPTTVIRNAFRKGIWVQMNLEYLCAGAWWTTRLVIAFSQRSIKVTMKS